MNLRTTTVQWRVHRMRSLSVWKAMISQFVIVLKTRWKLLNVNITCPFFSSPPEGTCAVDLYNSIPPSKNVLESTWSISVMNINTVSSYPPQFCINIRREPDEDRSQTHRWLSIGNQRQHSCQHPGLATCWQQVASWQPKSATKFRPIIQDGVERHCFHQERFASSNHCSQLWSAVAPHV